MRVRRQVDRHAQHAGCEVGAVVEVEAAQEELVGLAVAAVLRGDETGHRLQHFTRTQPGAVGDLPLRDGAFAGGVRGADQPAVALDLHRIERLGAAGQHAAGR
jgi:hypothetical protein